MSLVNLANVGAHLQNCSMARLPLAKIPYTKLHLKVALGLYKEGFIDSVTRGSTAGPDLKPVEVTYDNIATRRLWLGLKYRNGQPVLSKFTLISKPNRRVFVSVPELEQLASGKNLRYIPQLKPGEIVFVKTKDNEVMTMIEALKRNLECELLCRVR
ncbi:hypothetical protein KL918_001042 [Ogataea parapolymorpha]|uniref:37S ribosomal protein S8, mitochondrial n=1 Tax=Ogataea parapolymorpha (strain ATCC 26012 / BCRC 20466 / JCM 22074 / NRRL Y-7560 / DL-1) TaxID=871575 RepID=W1QAK6_OGAPD|nr:hypothetical protein HPODL_01528 [Ogataea parapolymorpha DL-1]ESW97429.1 hypothetical protein HPODL_01528 [Ogataea parapolymorpha DL-1]KAG7869497.1 hypothetical protein KL918_001042 [Ogataea parapolymorpha]KAG7875450.1 hypothetical protein KL916_000121 [Ogataea parapolymorpha]KAG7884287.1 hypothetical protein KL938_002159 [Ogataea parapolymorpha]